MKKLAVLLQIVALLAVCPVYVFLEITHYSGENSKPGSDPLTQPKTEIISSKTPDNKMQNTTSFQETK